MKLRYVAPSPPPQFALFCHPFKALVTSRNNNVPDSTEAVKSQHYDVTKCLADTGCDVNIAEREFGYTPLHQAIIMTSQIHPFRDNVDEEYNVLKQLKVCQLTLSLQCTMYVANV